MSNPHGTGLTGRHTYAAVHMCAVTCQHGGDQWINRLVIKAFMHVLVYLGTDVEFRLKLIETPRPVQFHFFHAFPLRVYLCQKASVGADVLAGTVAVPSTPTALGIHRASNTTNVRRKFSPRNAAVVE